MFIPTNLFKYFHENLLNFITNEQLKYTVVDQNRIPYAIKYNNELPYVAAQADEFGFLKIFKTNSNFKILKEDQLQKNCIYDLIWLTRNEIACCGGDQICFVIDCNNFNKIATLKGHTESVKSISSLKLNPFVIASGSRDGSILIYDLRCNKKEDNSLTPINCIQSAHSIASIKPGKNGTCKNTYKPSPVSTVLFYNDQILVSSGAIDSHIKLWDLRKTHTISKKIPDPIPLVSFNPQTNQNKGYSNLVFNHSFTRLYANCMNNSIYEFDMDDFHKMQIVDGPNHTNVQLKDIAVYNKHKNTSNFIKSCVSLCDNFLFTGSSDTIGYIYPLKHRDKYPYVCLEAHFNEVTAIDWCPHDFNQLITCSDDNTIRIWNVKKDLSSEDEAKCDLKRAKIGELESTAHDNVKLNEDFFRTYTKKKCPNLNDIIYGRDLVFPFTKSRNLFENLLMKTPIKNSKWKTPTENLPINLIEIRVTPKQVVKAKILTKREDNIVQLSIAKKRTIDLLFNDLLINNNDTPSSKRRLVMEENNQSTQATTPKTPRNRNTNRVRLAVTPQTPTNSVSKSILDYFSPRNLLK